MLPSSILARFVINVRSNCIDCFCFATSKSADPLVERVEHLPFFISSYLSYFLAFLLSYLLTFLLSYLLTFLPSNFPNLPPYPALKCPPLALWMYVWCVRVGVGVVLCCVVSCCVVLSCVVLCCVVFVFVFVFVMCCVVCVSCCVVLSFIDWNTIYK